MNGDWFRAVTFEDISQARQTLEMLEDKPHLMMQFVRSLVASGVSHLMVQVILTS